MAFDEKLAARLRDLTAERKDVEEKKMFGGLAFLVGGRMAFGIVGDDLMVRVGPEAHEDALARPHTRPMDFTGKPSRGMVYVARMGLVGRAALRAWIERGIRYALAQPKKPVRARSVTKPRARRAR